jgi:hypothetical protein
MIIVERIKEVHPYKQLKHVVDSDYEARRLLSLVIDSTD